MAERQFGPYRLVRQIAVGGMAEIHLAKTKGIAGFEKYVALKMIHPNLAEDEQFIQMLVDEAKIAVQLTHGNIAQTFDLGRVGETYYITMEYVDGADLYKILRRGSEMDHEMPLDCCAFIAKEVASALDHAHRKKDHLGKPLGIVHRDVSPQNVLISYSGEVKLVDFGIAKATMKARQTAVGVIKGKYYYMSPEQAWGDVIDYRSDIFSAGIVLYEMITGQMLYLEEDLHKLLDMARKADIVPPSRLRKGIPPQLEKIVMHALQKVPGDRYQSAGDFATDLERFLHAYSPVFTAAKVSGLLRKVVGDPVHVSNDAQLQEFPSIEVHEGANATFSLDTNDLLHAGEEVRDENSVIFRMDELNKPVAQQRSPAVATKPAAAPTNKPVVGAKPAQPGSKAPGNMTRATAPTEPPPIAGPGQPQRPPAGNLGAAVGAIPSIPNATSDIPRIAGNRPATPPTGNARPAPAAMAATPPTGAPQARLPISQPRKADEETRQLEFGGPADESGDQAITSDGEPARPSWSDPALDDGDLENIGERTMVTAPSGMSGMSGVSGFMMDADNNLDGVDATMVNQEPPRPDSETDTTSREPDEDTSDEETDTENGEDDGPTIQRDFTADRQKLAVNSANKRQAPPAALAAKIHAPAVSELRKPRASKRTPQGGIPAQANVLQQIVSKQANEPMPVPREPQPQQPQPQPQFPSATPGQQVAATGYATDASGLPMGVQTPPSGLPVTPEQAYPPGYPHYPPGYAPPGYPQQYPQQYPPGYAPPGYPQAAYPVMPGYPPGYAPPGYPPPGYPQQYPPGYPQQQPYGYPPQPVTPAGLYSFQPAPQKMTLTGQLRLFEVDDMPSQYKIGANRRRWFTYIVAGLIAISVAASATFIIIRTSRDAAPTVGSIRIESIPTGAEVLMDGEKFAGTTPLTIPSIPVTTRHDIRVVLKRHQPYDETVDIPKSGVEMTVKAVLKPVTGKLVVITQPDGAEVWINGANRGQRTPTTIKDLDVNSATKLELRLKDYQPHIEELAWPDDGVIQRKIQLMR